MPKTRWYLVIRFMAVVVAGFLFLAAAAQPASAYRLTNREKRLFMLIKKARAKHGKPPLQLSLKISAKAHRHSKDMSQRGYIYHSCLTCKFAGWNWHALAENITKAKTVSGAHQKFMKSAGHRQHILSTLYKRVGVGIVDAKGWLWVTEIFYG